MAITQLENFSRTTQGIELSALAIAAGAGSLGLPGAVPYAQSGSNWTANTEPFGLYVEKVGSKYWLGGGTGYGVSNAFSMLQINIAALAPASASTFTLGVRYKRKSAATAILNVPILRSSRGVYPSIAVPAGVSEWYVELIFSRADSKIMMYLDGRYLGTSGLIAGDVAELTANTWWIGIPVSSLERLFVTDIYATADIGDDTPSGRLGPQDITEIPMQVTSSDNWDITNIANVLAWKDFGTDTGKYVPGTGDGSVIKLKPVDGYVLPIQTAVNAVMIHSRCAYNQGNPTGVMAEIVRGTHTDSATTLLSPTVSLSNAAARAVSNSRTNDETVPASALNGLEVSLTVVAR